MDWLTNLVKHLSVSRPVTAAVFVASGVLLFGNRAFDLPVDYDLGGWSSIVLAVFVFTGILLLIWAVDIGKSGLSFSANWIRDRLPLRPLTDEIEKQIIYALAKQADRSLNLDDFHFRVNRRVSKLRLLEISRQLQKKGYIEIFPHNENIVDLSPRGRKAALDIEAEIDRAIIGRDR